MAGLRIECTPEEIEEIYSRLGHLFHTNNLSKPYESKNVFLKQYYLRIYTYERDTLLDQLLAAQKDIEHLTLENDRLLQTIRELRRRLNEEPQSQPWDAVLGGKNKDYWEERKIIFSDTVLS